MLHAGAAQVSALSAVGPAVGALIALPLGPWLEVHRKRPVMIVMDLTRFAVMMTVPAAYAPGCLSFVQLLIVSAVVAGAKIAFSAASGACLRALVRPADLLVANARFESATWSSTAVGPPLGGAAIGLFGPVTTVLADAASYLFSTRTALAVAGLAVLASPALRPRRLDPPVTGGRSGVSDSGRGRSAQTLAKAEAWVRSPARRWSARGLLAGPER